MVFRLRVRWVVLLLSRVSWNALSRASLHPPTFSYQKWLCFNIINIYHWNGSLPVEFSTEDTKWSAEGPQHFVQSWRDAWCLHCTVGASQGCASATLPGSLLRAPTSAPGQVVARGGHEIPMGHGAPQALVGKGYAKNKVKPKSEGSFSAFLNPWFSLKNKLR